MCIVRTPRRLLAPLIAALAFALHVWWFGDQFYLMEFRDWLLSPIDAAEVTDLLVECVVRDEPFSRMVGLGAVRVLGTCCIDEPWLVNGVLLALTPIAAWQMLRLAGGMGAFAAGVVGVVMWLVSEPVVDALWWQATVIDRLALVFSLAAIAMFLAFRRRPASGAGGLVVANVCITAATVLAFNSKESAWSLWPMLLALVGTGNVRRDARLLVLPAIWSAWYFVRWLASDAGGDQHVFGGDVWHNYEQHCARLTADLPGARWLVPAVVLGAVAAAVRRADLRALLLVALAGFVGGFVLVAPARLASPYYMYQPSLFFYLLCALLASLTAPRLRAVLFGALSLFVVVGAVDGTQRAARAAAWTRGVREARDELRTLLPVEVPRAVRFEVPGPLYMWVFGTSEGMARHVLGRDDWRRFADVELRVAWCDEPTAAVAHDEWCVRFTPAGRLQSVWAGARRLR